MIFLRHLIRSREVTNRIFFGKDLFFFMLAQHNLSYHLIFGPCSKHFITLILTSNSSQNNTGMQYYKTTTKLFLHWGTYVEGPRVPNAPPPHNIKNRMNLAYICYKKIRYKYKIRNFSNPVIFLFTSFIY